MKKMLMLIGLVFVFVVMGVSNGNASLIWQIGVEDGSNPLDINGIPSGKASDGAKEFGGQFYDPLGFNIDPNVVHQNSSLMPGYLNAFGSGDPNGKSVSTFALVFNFTLSNPINNALFEFGRYGSETDKIGYLSGPLSPLDLANYYFSGIVPPSFMQLPDADGGSGERASSWFSYDTGSLLGNLGIGEHHIGILYAGGDSNNGHYIDFARLSGNQVPEPISMLLFSSGIIGFFGVRRRIFKK